MPSRKCRFLCLFLSFLFGFPGVAEAFSTKMSRSDISSRLPGIHAIGMLSPDIRIYEFSAGGVREYKEDWSAKGKENVTKSLQESFGGRLIEIRQDALDNNVREELEEVLALYRSAIASYTAQSDAQNGFPVKRDFSEYVLGPLENLFTALKVDALVVVKGFDEISTGGRKALAVVGALAGVVLRPGITGLEFGVIDRGGAILWYRFEGSLYGNDFREPEGAAKITSETLTGYPGLKP